MNNRNFTHNSNFIFQTNLFNKEETIYSIQECNLPGISFSHIQINKSSVTGNFQGDTATYNDLSLTLIVDEKLTIWKDIVKTLQKMRDPYPSEAEEIVEYSYLEIHDDNSNLVVKLEFVDCLIESIGDLIYNTTEEDEIMTCEVSIKYDYYNIIE